MWDGANVSGHVASHTRTRPPFHGTIVAPSGRLPSDREMPVGFKCVKIFTAANDPYNYFGAITMLLSGQITEFHMYEYLPFLPIASCSTGFGFPFVCLPHKPHPS